MIVIRFGKWFHAFNGKYHYTRILRSGYRWTPFCKRERWQK